MHQKKIGDKEADFLVGETDNGKLHAKFFFFFV